LFISFLKELICLILNTLSLIYAEAVFGRQETLHVDTASMYERPYDIRVGRAKHVQRSASGGGFQLNQTIAPIKPCLPIATGYRKF
jgi:hypothetical protein